ncbi:hypothetical protein IC614_00825 [Allosphingosinicella flava]|uniref:Peptidase M56 domain-containing protein n=1 Tax=Allosphingosinicella flava TaxID=2771430 RepID=A0A7T2LM57_9SPHN|nr:M56 family metallopeptidase [Sphingosinicella flava]QPQ55196.1 hypothetical protein IC614_00825 [Sphingosinicella flava]
MSGDFASTLIGVHLALILVLIVRGPVARHLGSGWAYALWLLPLARLILPPLPAFPGSALAELPSSVPGAIVAPAVEVAAPPPSIDGSGQWMLLLLALWAGGAAIFLLWQAIAYYRLVRGIAVSGSPAAPFEGLETVESRATPSPLALGFLRRRIVLPADFRSRYTRDEQRLALVHEAVHLRRGDLWWNLVALIVLALNWFSPLAHLAFRAFRMDQELACDAAVASRIAPSARHAYATALVKSASQPGLIAACPLNHADQLKRRLKMMKTHGGGRARRIAGGIAAAGFLVVGLGLSGAHAAQDAEKTEPKREVRTEIVTVERKADDAKAGGKGPRVERKVHIRTVGEGKPGRDISIRGGEVTIDGKPVRELAEKCTADTSGVDVSEDGGSTMTTVRICAGAGTPLSAEKKAEMVQKLEGLKQRLGSDRLDSESRADVAAALERAIARIKGSE